MILKYIKNSIYYEVYIQEGLSTRFDNNYVFAKLMTSIGEV